MRRAASRMREGAPVIALVGNPNVGKSTVFNALTGAHQHTGNWPGKTVDLARGSCKLPGGSCTLVDLPGTYSLFAHSAEEEVTRDFLCFDRPDAAVVVCDATCLERNLNLVLQTRELMGRVLVCVNLMDEAERKGIRVDLEALSRQLHTPVVGVSAHRKRTLNALKRGLSALLEGEPPEPERLAYPEPVEKALAGLEPLASGCCMAGISPRWLALRFLEDDQGMRRAVERNLRCSGPDLKQLLTRVEEERRKLEEQGMDRIRFQSAVVAALVRRGEEICREVVRRDSDHYNALDRRLDRVLTSRKTGYPLMLLLLVLIFWITIVGANYPSDWLSAGLFWVQDRLTELCAVLGVPEWLHGALVLGVFRVLAWVVAVMLPPMAIFFPLFTLLEDAGYLPRVAYNLDRPFQICHACGKQALCMMMGFGCNAVGVTGCRIIDSPRERLLAILTNVFVPCNGRFPGLIAVLTIFFVGTAGGALSSLGSAVLLTGVIVLGIVVTFGVTRLLSATILRGVPSSFVLELPSYRKPQIGRVILRSILDRALFVLGRAVSVAAPAGLVLWVLANWEIQGVSALSHCAAFLDPLARLMGLDGVILIAFVLGFPANEIVVPIILMAYLSRGTLMEASSLLEMKEIFVANGWTWATACSFVLFSLMHWPCSTTLLTIHKETGSWRWTALAAALPTAIGMAACMLFTLCVHLLGLG